MKVTATRSVYVQTDKGDELLRKGESAEVDGRTYGDSHMFVKAGYLVAEKQATEDKPKRGRKPKQEDQGDEQSGSGESTEE